MRRRGRAVQITWLAIVCAAGASGAAEFGGREAGGHVKEAAAGVSVGSPADAPPGRWREAPTHRFDPGLDAEQRRMIRQLESLGYASGSIDAVSRSVITTYDRDRVQSGLNFYTSGHAQEALLADAEGQVLHRWSYDFWEAWPDYPVERDHAMTRFWRRAHLYPNGDVLAIYEGLGLLKLDRNSELVWAYPGRAHHDLEVLPNGDIYVLTREAHVVPRVNPRKPILEDFLTVLGPDGREKRRLSLLEAFERSKFAYIWQRSAKRSGDIFHTNTVRILDGTLAERDPAFRAGNVMISSPKLDAIAVLDPRSETIVWAHTGEFRRQHDPRLLSSGRVLLFDNRGLGDHSRVIEIEPFDHGVAWEYRGTRAEPFYSKTCGTAERLDNGNTLITESDNGRAFEVTHEGEIVWQFYSPHRAGPDDRYVATLFEMVRLPRDFPLDWLPERQHAAPAE